ncbi:bifunctional diguanylate cyclase/phosphodiesterase [Erythrobacter sp. THAF29]|uniref:putative bifunctional diguanylate cyclase/phosphodiesterase n=1 Tax=Erythrobacter sp. THAF29 TaxID=2587851 RepID=UPI0012685941|nr:EAL domain-containing protein [Erythrobacter sp. THAF29]QFT77470.1 Cyclic di-GMP phosphodiesterase Gmr [Erythrobacter sp. THAF29]
MAEEKQGHRLGSAEKDLVALGIATAAIILFVGTGGSVLPRVVNAVTSDASGPDGLLVNALLLNIALIIFGWRRYRQLNEEIAERRRAEAHARELAEIDPLTGCLNRRSMSAATDELRARAMTRGEAVGYAMIDLDNFKQINDMHGHSIGDQVLVQLSQRILEQLPDNAVLARLGGDEFAFVITYDPDARKRLDELVIRLFDHAILPFRLGSLVIDATMSIGIATDHDENGLNPNVCDAAELMHRADIAMYHAKKQGKNRYFWFEPNMETELRFRNELEAGIRAGLVNGEFVPYYEQQVDIDSGELVGFEMLARWQSPQMGLVSPEIFIPIAEEIGVIAELSEKLMKQAFEDALEWDEGLTLSVNISPVQLRDPWFAQKLLKLLVTHKLPPHRLEIEVTESCLHDNIGMVRSMITSLRNQGIRVSLDDFGTGYSSLEQLRSLPFDTLKIDRTFVRELRMSEDGSRIVDAIVSLGRGLGLPITAEGVESEEVLGSLKKIGNLKGQGFLYGKPETAAQVRERLREMGRLAAPLPVEKSEQEIEFEDTLQNLQRRAQR